MARPLLHRKCMQIQNSEIARQFNHLADLLEISGANPFRVRAYRNAARTLVSTQENISKLLQQHADLSALPGIGKDLAGKIEEIVNTGHLSVLDQIEKKTPAGLSELLKIPTLGPKRVQKLNQALGVRTLAELKKVSENKKILTIPGFGEKMRQSILSELEREKKTPAHRLRRDEAEEVATFVVEHLSQTAIQKIMVAGSFRRQQETVGDLDILVTGKNPEAITAHFLKFPEIEKIQSQGSTRSTVFLRSGTQVDLRVVPDESYGAALLYFTGSKAHNIALRTLAMKRGMKINEYGLYQGEKVLASRSEEEIYRALKLPWIEPELRENRGEIEAAQKGTLPKLLTRSDICGDLHVHTNETDGAEDLKTMVMAAKKMGYSYIGITDHSRRMAMAHGLDPKRMLRQIRKIDQLNEQISGITVLKSIEIDILADGSLDLPDEILRKLDYTVCSVHTSFRITREKQTERIIRAMENPHFKILGHPSGRLLGEREPYEVDMEKIIRAAKMLGKCLEINAQPERMDLTDLHCRMAKDAGVKMVISTDAHSIPQLQYMEYGVGQARRGWLEKSDVINTLSLSELKKRFKNS